MVTILTIEKLNLSLIEQKSSSFSVNAEPINVGKIEINLTKVPLTTQQVCQSVSELTKLSSLYLLQRNRQVLQNIEKNKLLFELIVLFQLLRKVRLPFFDKMRNVSDPFCVHGPLCL